LANIQGSQTLRVGEQVILQLRKTFITTGREACPRRECHNLNEDCKVVLCDSMIGA